MIFFFRQCFRTLARSPLLSNNPGLGPGLGSLGGDPSSPLRCLLVLALVLVVVVVVVVSSEIISSSEMSSNSCLFKNGFPRAQHSLAI